MIGSAELTGLFGSAELTGLFGSAELRNSFPRSLLRGESILAQYNELQVYKTTYDLLFAIFQFTKDFTKEYKYTIGASK